jgi:hypothetical protein
MQHGNVIYLLSTTRTISRRIKLQIVDTKATTTTTHTHSRSSDSQPTRTLSKHGPSSQLRLPTLSCDYRTLRCDYTNETQGEDNSASDAGGRMTPLPVWWGRMDDSAPKFNSNHYILYATHDQDLHSSYTSCRHTSLPCASSACPSPRRW